MQRKVISALLAGVVVLQAAMVVPVIAQAQEKPTKISTVTTKNVTQTSITYVWQTDLHVSGYKIDRYQNKKWVTVKNITDPKIGSWKMTGLKSDTIYKVRLYKYIKTKGGYTYGEPVVYTTATNPPPVRNVKISTGKTTADVSWSRPSNCHGYTVMFYTGSGKNAKQMQLNDGCLNGLYLGSLKRKTKYKIEIQAIRTKRIDGKTYFFYSDWATKTFKTK